MNFKVHKNDAEWRAQLTPEQYAVCRKKGTEAPWSGEYCATKAPGTYSCVCCGAPLFRAEQKFESGSGWPSYTTPVADSAVTLAEDVSHGMHRVEVMCATCGAHLGHVFDDGPPPSGRRYCINSVCLVLARSSRLSD